MKQAYIANTASYIRNMKLFGSKRLTLDALHVPDFGWRLDKSTKTMRQWINPDLPVGLSIHLFKGKPDIPTISDIEVLRQYYRDQVHGQGGGIISVESKPIKNLPVVRTIFKFPQQPAGTMYLGSYTFPFATSSFVIKLQAMELGDPGMRESMVAQALIDQGKLIANEEGHYPGWASDPYDSRVEHSFLMNKADGIAYDLQFPDHPLSQVRTLLTQLSWETEPSELLYQQTPFE